MELAGSLGDLGTLLPLSIGMILINGLDPTGLIMTVGIFYIVSGLYFKVTSPVEPMKVIGAYAVATGITATQIQASCLWVFIFLAIIGGTNLINLVGRYVPKSAVRGVQLSTGIMLASQGVHLMFGSSRFQTFHQAAEPFLRVQHIGWLPIGLLIGFLLGFLTLVLLDNKRLPAALVVAGSGILVGLIWGTREGMDAIRFSINLPQWLPKGLPSGADFSFALLVLVLPQIPMTIGNAVMANADLSIQYFPQDGRRVTYRALCISMAWANLLSFFVGGMPMCHGAGGLASRYRFGARTAGSNLIIGGAFFLLAFFLGSHALAIIYLLPMAALGVLLIFAGTQLALTISDMQSRVDLFVPMVMLAITLATNLAAAFVTGIGLAYFLKWKRISV
jgi:SulP family sulfate permease